MTLGKIGLIFVADKCLDLALTLKLIKMNLLKNLFQPSATLLACLAGAVIFINSACFSTEKQKIDEPVTWNPHAGFIPSLTADAQVNITASSGDEPDKVLDDDEQTFWQSQAPYPTAFLQNRQQNLLLHFFQQNNLAQLAPASDGNLETEVSIKDQNENHAVLIDLQQPTNLYAIAIKASANADINMVLYDQDHKQQHIITYRTSDNYQWKRFSALSLPFKVARIKMECPQNFFLFEIAALETPPTEYVTITLPKAQNIQHIFSRHYQPDKGVAAVRLVVSKDGKTWQPIATLQPNALHSAWSSAPKPEMVQHLRFEFEIVDRDWAKAFLWEIKVYDQYAYFGAPPAPTVAKQSIAQTMGINGIWGWGNTTQSDLLDPQQGAARYVPIASHARNYHEMNWDTPDPDIKPNYLQMKQGRGTAVQPWLNWDKEYEAWKKAGMDVQVSIQFTNKSQPMSQWDNPQQAAYQYGLAFAQHFGKTYGNGLVSAAEVGNEPWDYPADFYRAVLRGMAAGLKQGDPQITVLPCALQAAEPKNERGDLKNYTGSRITPQEAALIDVLNVHYYAHSADQEGIQRGVYPEHPLSAMRAVFNDIRFRNQNMPQKPIWVSEWGWDSDGGQENCTHSVCVTEQAQAVYAVRGLFWFNRLGVERMTWYFYANTEGGSSLFTRSGLTASKEHNFEHKQAYTALADVKQKMGDTRFLKIIQEDTIYAYLFGKKDETPTHIVAWLPIDVKQMQFIKWKTNLPKPIKKAYYFDGTTIDKIPNNLYNIDKQGNVIVNLSAIPIVIELLF